jgi:hypothetical protein
MNKRIKELARQAGFHTDEPTKNFGNYQEDKEYFIADDFIHVELENFAELIVAECMELASKEQKRYASITHRNMSECAVALGNFSLLMKDHFEDEQ